MWTLIAGVGGIVAIWGAFDAWSDLKALGLRIVLPVYRERLPRLPRLPGLKPRFGWRFRWALRWYWEGNAGNGRRRLVKGDIRTELVRFTIQWSWFCIGVSAIWAPGDGRWNIPVAVLIGSIAALLMNSMWALWDRYAIRRMA